MGPNIIHTLDAIQCNNIREHLQAHSVSYIRNLVMTEALEKQRKMLIVEVMNTIEPKEEYNFLRDVLDQSECFIEAEAGLGYELIDLIKIELTDNWDINALYELLPEAIH